MILEPPYRVRHDYLQRYEHPASAVFELCCPVRECEWVEGWDPVVVWTECGLVEPGCTWLMQDGAIWFTAEHDPHRGRLRLLKTIPGFTVCDIEIEVRPTGASSCELELVYTHTAIGDAGRDFCDGLSEEAFTEFAQGWQRALDAALSNPRGEDAP